MDLANVIVECHARERALMVELEAAKIARVEAEGRESKALAEKEAANREKEAVALLAESLRGEKDLLRRENETLRASTCLTVEAVQIALKRERERAGREVAEDKFYKEQRSLWLRSPEAALAVLSLTAQNGYCAEGFKNLSRAFRYDEQLWDAIKDRSGPGGRTHLMAAALKNDVERVRFLLKRRANVNAALHNGWTALMMVSEDGHLEIARLLIGKGANVNAALVEAEAEGVELDNDDKYDGMSSLMFACENGHLETALLLIEKGANVDAGITDDGFNSLIWVCQEVTWRLPIC